MSKKSERRGRKAKVRRGYGVGAREILIGSAAAAAVGIALVYGRPKGEITLNVSYPTPQTGYNWDFAVTYSSTYDLIKIETWWDGNLNTEYRNPGKEGSVPAGCCQVMGGDMTPGDHVLSVRAVDVRGNAASQEIAVTLT